MSAVGKGFKCHNPAWLFDFWSRLNFHEYLCRPQSMFGLKAVMSVVCSNVCPTLHSSGSDRCLPTNWIVRGSPSLFFPQGKEILGDPLKS